MLMQLVCDNEVLGVAVVWSPWRLLFVEVPVLLCEFRNAGTATCDVACDLSPLTKG